jgi:hypothetical protein
MRVIVAGIVIAPALSVLALSAQQPPQASSTVTFTKHIAPILQLS